DGRFAVTGSFRGQGIKVWNAADSQLLTDLAPEVEQAELGFSPDGRWLMAGVRPGYRIWRGEDWGAHATGSRGGGGAPAPFAFSGDGKVAALETAPARVELIDVSTGGRLAALEDPLMHQSSWLALSPDGSYLVTAVLSPHLIHVWDLRRLRE